ncbi:MAG TPA: 3-deoxy-D-manno-octulosonic acid kinase [Gammaproteobacteria bacterium]|nr:3-deoxy-D-manno-octulosonic acid kinase [Gammaproteobacteria bacterium]
MREKIQTTKNGLILYDPAQLDQPHEHLFDPEHWRSLGQLQATPAGRGASWFVGGSAKQLGFWVLRHYRRGGLPGKVLRDSYLWAGNACSRPFAEWRLLASLYQQGLPVPQPVAARIQRTALWYQGDIITRRLSARSWSGLLQGTQDAERWQAVGACIRRFHNAGVWHADLNAHNILLDEHGKVYLIDFDRGRFRAGTGWQADNLARLARSLEKILGAEWVRLKQTHWPLLLNAYGTGAGG